MLIPIDNPADPRLSDYNDLTDAQLRAASARGELTWFIAEGEGVVRHLLASRFPTRSLLITPGHVQKLGDAISLLPESTPIYIVEKSLMEAITGFPFHRGVLASGGRIPDPPLHEILHNAACLVIAEHLSNVENIGAIFRNVACMVGQTAAVLLTPDCCHPLYRKPLRVSMGHALRIPFATLGAWPGDLEAIKAHGFTTIALTPTCDAADIRRGALAGVSKPAFLVGAEGPGLSEVALAGADRRARIPMADGADSLNVATALAVALSHMEERGGRAQ